MCQAVGMLVRIFGLACAATLLACTPKPAQPDAPPQKICTAMGCVNGLNVSVAKATAWPAGVYDFVLDLDGTAVTCTGALPLKPCDEGPSLTCTPTDKVQITESGCALPTDQHGFGDIHIEGAPANVKLTIRTGETVLFENELRPEYRTLQPNGPDCEPTCRSASGAITLQ